MAGTDSRLGWIAPGAKPESSLRLAPPRRQRYIQWNITIAIIKSNERRIMMRTRRDQMPPI
jgi:hypothetical protein